ncbi:secretory lipase [Hyphomicrobium sulfonivorans]|uniref:Secretory lipase n=2 Tax=Hyphomicrobium sulfonivorans TaxID=121290 RepID=A0A120CUT4_HYPSL|nr:secretory lipase [Hyphomicrobium sulfonivorans]
MMPMPSSIRTLIRKGAAAAMLTLLALQVLPQQAALAAGPHLRKISDAELKRAKPGDVFHIYPQIGGAPENAKAFRIIYRSTGAAGEPIAVSGTVIYPNAPAPAGGRDVIAWAHYTTGVSSRCAPTLLPNLSGTIPGLESMLDRGYVVVATDYEGLGVAGVHAYLVGNSEAQAVLDSVRAARHLAGARATRRFAVWGHSQGGHAALFSGELAPSYAPELQLVGIAAAAPATYLVDLFRSQKDTITGDSLIAMALLSWSRTYNIPLDQLLMRGVRERFEQVAENCIQSISQMLQTLKLAQPLKQKFLKVDPVEVPEWRALMESNSPGHGAIKVPVFISQGTGDRTVNWGLTTRYAKALCARGTPVTSKILKGVSHSFIAEKTAYAAVQWMDRRFAGKPVENDCPRH